MGRLRTSRQCRICFSYAPEGQLRLLALEGQAQAGVSTLFKHTASIRQTTQALRNRTCAGGQRSGCHFKQRCLNALLTCSACRAVRYGSARALLLALLLTIPMHPSLVHCSGTRLCGEPTPRTQAHLSLGGVRTYAKHCVRLHTALVVLLSSCERPRLAFPGAACLVANAQHHTGCHALAPAMLTARVLTSY